MRKSFKEILNKILNIFLVIASIFMCGVIAFNLTHVKIVVVGISMNPTVENQETGYMQKVFKNTKIERFDVVAVQISNETNYIKRIVGLPGETIKLDGDDLYVNGQLIEQTFEFIPCVDGDFNGTYVLSDNQYFILGDNRKDTVAPLKIEREQIEAKNGFIVANCTLFDGENCKVKENKKWRKING